ncbi:MAG: hypothetical protein RSC29_00790 [Oscillospiraceae bacterium]
MPNLTTPIPSRLSGDTKNDIAAIKDWGTGLIDELSYIFNNLDAGNVSEAAAVKAENINTNTAKIKNAQIGELTADKLTAGTIDTEKITVADGSHNLQITGSKIAINDGVQNRFKVEYDKERNAFSFALFNNNGEPTVYINSFGDAVFSGQLEGSEIFASTIVGTDSVSYSEARGGVFAAIDQTGIKIMQDSGGNRKQKFGATVANNGTAYLVMGAGNGSGKVNINGVTYTNGTLKVEKHDTGADIGIVGSKSFINFWENGQLWLSGSSVKINGRDILAELDALKIK